MPKRTYYHLTSNLSNLLKTLNEDMYMEMHNMINDYEEQYRNHAKIIDWPSVAHNYNETIQDFIDKMLTNDIPPISCKKGCAACCSLSVDISNHEAELLIGIAKDENIEIDWDKLSRQKGLDYNAWFKLGKDDMRCVFLDNQTNSCKIYEYRPASCRKAMVVSPAELCDTITHPGGQVQWAVNTPAEILASAIFNATESGSMPDMLIKQNQKNKL